MTRKQCIPQMVRNWIISELVEIWKNWVQQLYLWFCAGAWWGSSLRASHQNSGVRTPWIWVDCYPTDEPSLGGEESLHELCVTLYRWLLPSRGQNTWRPERQDNWYYHIYSLAVRLNLNFFQLYVFIWVVLDATSGLKALQQLKAGKICKNTEALIQK